MPAGAVATALDLAPNTLTFHFDRLRTAGLVTVRRDGRSMIYAAQFETMNSLLGYLTDNCSVAVNNIPQSIGFYSALFAAPGGSNSQARFRVKKPAARVFDIRFWRNGRARSTGDARQFEHEMGCPHAPAAPNS
jgi:hypothetical protein